MIPFKMKCLGGCGSEIVLKGGTRANVDDMTCRACEAKKPRRMDARAERERRASNAAADVGFSPRTGWNR